MYKSKCTNLVLSSSLVVYFCHHADPAPVIFPRKHIQNKGTLYLSGSQTTLYDSLMVHVDGDGKAQGLTVSVGANKKCPADLKERKLQKFKTKVSIKRAEGGPTPFLDKFREELQKRVPGREGEAPQGFFAKYWMYIVPAYLFLTLMGNGGGGESKGGGAAPASA